MPRTRAHGGARPRATNLAPLLRAAGCQRTLQQDEEEEAASTAGAHLEPPIMLVRAALRLPHAAPPLGRTAHWCPLVPGALQWDSQLRAKLFPQGVQPRFMVGVHARSVVEEIEGWVLIVRLQLRLCARAAPAGRGGQQDGMRSHQPRLQQRAGRSSSAPASVPHWGAAAHLL